MQRSKVPVAETGLALPPDVVEEILLRVPARPLSRFRVVCRSRRSFLSDPSFVKAHAALRRALILALAEDDDRIDAVDFSGRVVKQIRIPPAPDELEVMPPPRPAGPSFLFRANNRLRLVELDTGAVSTLPSDAFERLTSYCIPAIELIMCSGGSQGAPHLYWYRQEAPADSSASPFKQYCHVLSLGGKDDDDDNRQPQCWRQTPSPPMFVKSNAGFHGVSIRGFVYFLTGSVFNTHYQSYPCNHRMNNVKTDGIALFDLDNEQWRPATLRGPPEIISNITCACKRILAEISNTLVVMMYNYHQTDMEFWFGEDLEKDLWVKKLVVRRELLEPCPYMSLDRDIRQVMELEDGRIVFSYFMSWSVKVPHWRTRVYDPRTKSYADVPRLGDRCTVGVCVESLL